MMFERALDILRSKFSGIIDKYGLDTYELASMAIEVHESADISLQKACRNVVECRSLGYYPEADVEDSE